MNPQPFRMLGNPGTSRPLKRLSVWSLSRSLARLSFQSTCCSLASSVELRMNTCNGLFERASLEAQSLAVPFCALSVTLAACVDVGEPERWGSWTCPKVDDLMEWRVTSCATRSHRAGSFVQFCLCPAPCAIHCIESQKQEMRYRAS